MKHLNLKHEMQEDDFVFPIVWHIIKSYCTYHCGTIRETVLQWDSIDYLGAGYLWMFYYSTER